MNLDHLKMFTAVYRAGGFAPVAVDLNVAPSSISRAIAGLEAELQSRLFHRTTRQLTPTEAGETFYRRIAPLVEELEAACLEAADKARGPAGRLRITSSASFGQLVIAPLLQEFRKTYPDIEIEFLLSDQIVNLVEESIDIAVRHGVLADSSMLSRKLMDVDYILVASPEYLQNKPPIEAPEDIETHQTVSFHLDSFRSCWRFRNGKDLREIAINPVAIVSQAAALVRCVKDGMGLALVADWTVVDELKSGKLVHVLPDWEAAGGSFDASISLVFPSRAYMPDKSRAFADFIVNAVKEKRALGKPA